MRLRKATCLAPMLLLAAGLGVFASAAHAQGATPKKTSSSKAGAASHGKRTSKKSKRRERGQNAPTPDRLSQIQQALAKDGSFARKTSGQWDARSEEHTSGLQS